MTLFLTSHIGGSVKENGKIVPSALIEDNGLVLRLKERWPHTAKLLFVASAPDEFERNDAYMNALVQSLNRYELNVESGTVLDERNRALAGDLKLFDVIVLAGGHVPTQNAFFERIGLREQITEFNGIVIGISAGTMNSARIVYAQPELEGESIDPAYKRFLNGIGLTKLMIIPHWQWVKGEWLDGQRVFEDITCTDSMGREFLALPDGSYVISENAAEILYGEGFLIRNGKIEQICENGEKRLL